MKTKLLLFVLVVTSLVSCKKTTELLPAEVQNVVNEANVPITVLAAFNSAFTGATQVEWRTVATTGRTTKQEFEVEFNHQNQRHICRFEDNGTQKGHSISCTSGNVPQIILTAFRATHPSEVVTEWKLLANGSWKAHYLKGAIVWEATYTAAGVLVKDELA
jgi:hypothetical protein